MDAVDLHVRADGCRAGPAAGAAGWTIARPPELFTADDWQMLIAHVGDAVLHLWIEPPDVHVVDLAVRENSRDAVALVLKDAAPVALGRLRWGHAASNDARGHVRVAMAHRNRVDSIAGAMRRHGVGRLRVLAGEADAPIEIVTGATLVGPGWAALLLASIPFTIALGATVMRLGAEWRPETAATGGVTLGAAIVRTMQQPSATELLQELAVALPSEARLHAVRRTADGAVTVEVDASDPVRVRAAFAGSRMLRPLRTVGQQAIADRGVRMTLRTDGS